MTTPYRTNSVLSHMLAGFGVPTLLFGKLLLSRRRRLDRDREAEVLSDLIERADDHILNDLGCTRDDLFRMRAKLYD